MIYYSLWNQSRDGFGSRNVIRVTPEKLDRILENLSSVAPFAPKHDEWEIQEHNGPIRGEVLRFCLARKR